MAAGCEADLGHRWRSALSIGRQRDDMALTSHHKGTNFGRLRKSYATMRKSFRLQLGGGSRSGGEQPPTGGRQLVSQLGLGAARLLRGALGRTHQLELAETATNGSFRTLAGAEPDRLSHGRARKSEQEIEIEQRLRRSKRRVLPSASYRAPHSERACEGLDLDALERIKCDNLRLALSEPAPQETGDGTSCSCKDLIDATSRRSDERVDSARLNVNSAKQPDPIYCSCVSIDSLSSFALSDCEGNHQRARTPPDKRSHVTDVSRLGASECNFQESLDVCCGDGGNDEADSRALVGNESDIASGRRAQIEDKLEAMFSSMGEFTLADDNNKRRTIQQQQQQQLGTDACGQQHYEPTTDTCCALSNRAGKTRLASGELARQPKVRAHLNARTQLGGATERTTKTLTADSLSGACCEPASSIDRPSNARNGSPDCSASQARDMDDIELVAYTTATSARETDHHDNNNDNNRSWRPRGAKHAPTSRGNNKTMLRYSSGERIFDGDAEAQAFRMSLAALDRCDDDDDHEIDELYAQIDDRFGRTDHVHSRPTFEDERDAAECYGEGGQRWSHLLDQQEQQRVQCHYRGQALFRKQLNNKDGVKANAKFQQQELRLERNDNKPKRSFLSKIKNMIVTSSKSSKNNAHHFSSHNLSPEHSRPIFEPEFVRSGDRWQKSRTLGPKCRPDPSQRYLSMSRKSINLIGFDNDELARKREEECEYKKSSLVNGFLTIGRRSNTTRDPVELVHQIFNNRSVQPNYGSSRRRFGSADSLPSADSGLSCSNLQNSSSGDEHYVVMSSLRPPVSVRLDACGDESVDVGDDLVVVGRAKAKVDCNPCAYDKEALVFKQGDIIEILERNQSGTWIGRCGQQVGHFKFINVIEIDGDGGNDDDDGNGAEHADVEPEACNERKQTIKENFVTKLEIKSNGYQLESSSTQINHRRRSLSVNTIQDGDTDDRIKRGKDAIREFNNTPCSRLTSSESIASSLEQLLFAIGLAGEQLTPNNLKPDHDAQLDGQEGGLRSATSYLDVLYRSGINNLDSFSAISDCCELKQMGIVDDEHQRRLLMAAKIIRQASRAAKLDFVENYRIKPALIVDNKTDQLDNGSNSTDSNRAGSTTVTTGNASDGDNQSKRTIANFITKGSMNEPIYANLVKATGLLANRGNCGEQQQLMGTEQQAFDYLTVDLNTKMVNQKGYISRLPSDQSSPQDSTLGRQAEQSSSDSRQIGQTEAMTRTDSINQFEHNRKLNSRTYASHANVCLLDQTLASAAIYDNDNDHYERQVVLNVANGQPIRDYSSRMSRQASVLPFSDQSGYDMSQPHMAEFFYERQFIMAQREEINPLPARSFHPERTLRDSHKRHPATGCDMNQTRTTSNMCSSHWNKDSSHLRLNQNSRKQRTRPDSANIRSQINSKSAYDLRLDLSHFFS